MPVVTTRYGNMVSCLDPSSESVLQITISCLRQLYNAVGYNTSATNGNQIAVTAYTGEYANNQDLQQFFQLENPAAYGSNYTFVSINGSHNFYPSTQLDSLTMYSGGLNNQSLEAAGDEANLDTQFAFGLTHPTPATFYSTGGSPRYIPDAHTPTNTNEPYMNVCFPPFHHCDHSGSLD